MFFCKKQYGVRCVDKVSLIFGNSSIRICAGHRSKCISVINPDFGKAVINKVCFAVTPGERMGLDVSSHKRKLFNDACMCSQPIGLKGLNIHTWLAFN